MDFLEFSLHEDLQKGITAAGYVSCTPVQEQVLKTASDGADLYVQSQTGTGKTAAYLISVSQEMLAKEENAGKKLLILVPTRELAVQVEEEAKTLLGATKLKAYSFYGGVGYEKQVAALKRDVDIIIGTPGRVIDLIEGGQMSLEKVGFLVVDEADRMFDMGFYPDLRKILKHLPEAENRQTMLFSATLNSYVKNLAWEYTRDAKEITIEAENIVVSEIDQELLHVSSDEKVKLLVGIMNKEKPASCIIFCNTKRGCEVLGKRLKINGIESDYLIGDMPQSKRLKVLENFKEGKVPVLVATDVAARGIDVSDLQMVVNYDLPNEAENYVHRIGRTARAGKSGKAYTFCSEQDVYNLPAIERFIDMQIPANVADPALLGEDKSEGIYIKTENWHEDSYDEDSRYGARGRRGRSDSARGGRRGRDSERAGRSDRRSSRSSRDEKMAGRRARSGDEKNNDRRQSRRMTSPEELKALENLSFEERMKLYKEKYASKSSEAESENAKSGKARFDKNSSRKRPDKKYADKNYRFDRNGTNRNGQNRNGQKSARGLDSRKGLFSKILSFFKGK